MLPFVCCMKTDFDFEHRAFRDRKRTQEKDVFIRPSSPVPEQIYVPLGSKKSQIRPSLLQFIFEKVFYDLWATEREQELCRYG